MSRIGINPVNIVSGVEVKIDESRVISVKGPKGTLIQQMPKQIKVDVESEQIKFSPVNDNDKDSGAYWGLARSLVNNMVEGVTNGFTKNLEIQGVGYKAQAQGKNLKLNLGYSHDIDFAIPEGIEIKTPSPTQIEVSGIDKQKVGQVAAEIRAFRKPEPYKGKGVRYEGEYIIRKEGKKK